MKEPKIQDWEINEYTDDPELPDIKDLIPVKNFLPPPEELVFKYPKKKITLNLESNVIDFFKDQAKRLHTSYQEVIQNLLKDHVKQTKAQTTDQYSGLTLHDARRKK